MLIERFKNHNNKDHYCLLSEEMSIKNSRARIDLGGYEIVNGELDSSIGIEIKVSQSDFYSGYGRNFDFEWNYLAVPTELVSLAIRMLRRWNKKYVGVIEVDSRSNVNIIQSANYHGGCFDCKPININGISYTLNYPIHRQYVDNEYILANKIYKERDTD